MPELKRILYVEDEPDIRKIALIALEKLGDFDVKMCASGLEAIDCAVEFAPDLVLLDVMMPGVNGPETLDRLREFPELQTVPAIFMTAKIQANEIEQLKRMSVIEVIKKPFDVMALPDRLRELWKRHNRN